MDIDKMQMQLAELLAFKAKYEPMLTEALSGYRGERRLGAPEPISQELHDAIHAPLPDGPIQYATDEPKSEPVTRTDQGGQEGDPNAPGGPQKPDPADGTKTAAPQTGTSGAGAATQGQVNA